MVNPFTLQSKIHRMQEEVLRPLYGDDSEFEHEWLLAETGRAIARHKKFIEGLCHSTLISVIFSVIKLLGGAEQLTEDDFKRFTSYVNDGGLDSMIAMLLDAEKEKCFINELKLLPRSIQENAPAMLIKAKVLHKDFIARYFDEIFGSNSRVPQKMRDNYLHTDNFLETLVGHAKNNLL